VRQFSPTNQKREERLLLLLGFTLLGLLRGLLSLLCLLSHVALRLSEMASTHQCNRESICTAFQLLQRDLKSSVPLKEVLMRNAAPARMRRRSMRDRTARAACEACCATCVSSIDAIQEARVSQRLSASTKRIALRRSRFFCDPSQRRNFARAEGESRN
jgi:hypothetical protein